MIYIALARWKARLLCSIKLGLEFTEEALSRLLVLLQRLRNTQKHFEPVDETEPKEDMQGGETERTECVLNK